jgi:hypothetical protein
MKKRMNYALLSGIALLSVMHLTINTASGELVKHSTTSGVSQVIAQNSNRNTIHYSDRLTAGISTVIKHNSNNGSALTADTTDLYTSVVGSAESILEEVMSPTYYDESKTMYATTTVNVRSNYTTTSDDNIIGKLSFNSSVEVVGEFQDFYVIQYGEVEGYVAKEFISEESIEARTYNTSWTGKTLSRSCGVVQGPSGRETYYNLDMSGVIRIMRRNGYSEEEYPYWVRSDGVKCLGPYLVVACDLSIRPRGSLVETSLGTGIVCDTGTFVYTYPTGIDIATTW